MNIFCHSNFQIEINNNFTYYFPNPYLEKGDYEALDQSVIFPSFEKQFRHYQLRSPEGVVRLRGEMLARKVQKCRLEKILSLRRTNFH